MWLLKSQSTIFNIAQFIFVTFSPVSPRARKIGCQCAVLGRSFQNSPSASRARHTYSAHLLTCHLIQFARNRSVISARIFAIGLAATQIISLQLQLSCSLETKQTGHVNVLEYALAHINSSQAARASFESSQENRNFTCHLQDFEMTRRS